MLFRSVIQATVGVSGKRVRCQVNRALLPVGARYLYNQQCPPVQMYLADMTVGQQVHADLVAIVQSIEEFFPDLGDSHYPLNDELLVSFTEAKYDDATLRIRKRAVGRPEVVRHRPLTVAASGEFAFQIARLSQQRNVSDRLDVDHATVAGIRSTVEARISPLRSFGSIVSRKAARVRDSLRFKWIRSSIGSMVRENAAAMG